MAYSMLGRYSEAIEVAQGLVEEFPLRLDFKGRLATAYAQSGDSTQARRLSNEIAAVDEDHLQGIPELWRARIAAQLGERERAVELLRQAFGNGMGFEPNPVHSRFWHTDPDFESLRDYEPYVELARAR